MDARTRDTLENVLRDRRAALLKLASDEEADLAAIAAEPTAEFEDGPVFSLQELDLLPDAFDAPADTWSPMCH